MQYRSLNNNLNFDEIYAFSAEHQLNWSFFHVYADMSQSQSSELSSTSNEDQVCDLEEDMVHDEYDTSGDESYKPESSSADEDSDEEQSYSSYVSIILFVWHLLQCDIY